jgi:protease I
MARLDGKRIAIVTAHEFEDVEVLYPVLRLSEEGAAITVATLPKNAFAHFHARSYHSDKPITGRFGSTVPFVALEEGKRWRHLEIPEKAPLACRRFGW